LTLRKYKAKRDFEETPEPAGAKGNKTRELRFVVQKHAARRLHYDFRLEYNGVLLSWAVPKGPSMDPQDKRLAIQVEDHPIEYQYFEGEIPKGSYGAGTVEIWDKGTYTVPDAKDVKEAEQKIKAGLQKGHLDIILDGEKLQGRFALVKLQRSEKGNEWLLIKSRDSTPTPTPSLAPQARELKEKDAGTLTHLDKVYWPKEKYTKGDLLDYYRKVSRYILPYLQGRPIVLHRYPEGIAGEDFYQKELGPHPKWVETRPVKHEDKTVNYLFIDDEKSLLFAVNLGSIDLHPFLARYDHLEQPDFCVMDLDPQNLPFNKAVESAEVVHEILEEVGVPHYCKTSGGRGLHIYIPLHAKYDYEQSRLFAELIASIAHQRLPSSTSLIRNPQKREKKVYLDYLQNRTRQTVVAPYAVRPRPHAMVSTPLEWREVKKGLDPEAFTIKTVPERLKKIGDIFKPVLGKGINLIAALKKLEKL